MPFSTVSGTGTGIFLTRSRAGLLTIGGVVPVATLRRWPLAPCAAWRVVWPRLGRAAPFFCCLAWAGFVRGLAAGPCVFGWLPFWAGLCFAGVVCGLVAVSWPLGPALCGGVCCGFFLFFVVVWVGRFCGRGLFLAGWGGFWGWVVAVWVLVVVAFGGFAVVVGGFWPGVGVAPLSAACPWLALCARVAFPFLL